MSNRIENLGDYNKVRIDLQNAGGDLDILYGKIGATAGCKSSSGVIGCRSWNILYRSKECSVFQKEKGAGKKLNQNKKAIYRSNTNGKS